jgi:hypothetical protein
VKKTSIASIALICLAALSVIYGLATITVCHADNSKPYSPEPVEPLDNSKPYGPDPIIKLEDNSKPY